MINLLLRIFPVLLVVILTGCATSKGVPYSMAKNLIPEADSTKSRIYFLREKSFVNGGVKAKVTVNGTNIGILNGGGFIYHDIFPGEVTLGVEESFLAIGSEHTLQTGVQPGKDYFFLVANNSKSIVKSAAFGIIGTALSDGRFVLKPLQESQGSNLVRTLKYDSN